MQASMGFQHCVAVGDGKVGGRGARLEKKRMEQKTDGTIVRRGAPRFGFSWRPLVANPAMISAHRRRA